MGAPGWNKEKQAVLRERLSHSSQKAFALAEEVRAQLGHSQLEPRHLLYGLCQKPDGAARPALAELGVTPENLLLALGLESLDEGRLPRWEEVHRPHWPLILDSSILQVMRQPKAVGEQGFLDQRQLTQLLLGLDHSQVQRLKNWGRKGESPVAQVQQVQEAVQEVSDPQPVVLLRVGTTSILAQVSRAPWLLPVHAFTLPTGPMLGFGGMIAEALSAQLGAKNWMQLVQAIGEERNRQERFEPDMPLLVDVPDEVRGAGLPGKLFVATAETKERRSIALAAQATVAVARHAAQVRLSRIALPLLGTGTGGLQVREVAQAMLHALAEQKSFDGLDTLLITTPDPRQVKTLKEAALAVSTQLLPLTPPERAAYDNDDVQRDIHPENDRLGIRAEVDQFARLLIASDVKPPLSIGLFGDWGSGKTFFMRLLQARIRELSTQQSSKKAASRTPYHANVAQIEFNAWHYADASLWASLAVRIFDGLAHALKGEQEGDVERIRRELRGRLSSNEQARQHILELQKEAQQRRTLAQGELAALQSMRTQSRQELLETVFQALRKNDSLEKPLRELSTAASGFGLPSLIGSVVELKRLAEELRTLNGRASALSVAVSARFDGIGKSLRSVFALGTVLTGVALLGAGAGWLKEHISWLKGALPQASVVLVQVATLVSAAVGWASRRVASLSKATEQAEALLARLEQSPTSLTREESQLREESQKLDAEIQNHAERIAEADRRIKEAEAELQRIDEGGLVYDFLQNRVRSARYVEQLGLISTIRQDFEQLHTLLEDLGKQGRQRIDRIILYIDDLDRCHPDRVVEVLQAIHLLLAFDLFSVVVGYMGERDAQRREELLEGARVFSPQNYLEKIFQIPFSLSRMDEEGFSSLIDHLVTTRSEVAPSLSPGSEKASVAEPSLAPRHDSAPGTQGEEKAEPLDAPPRRQEAEAALAQDAELLWEALFLEDWEQSYLQRFGRFIQTPRLAKRFINLYRLLRVQAARYDFQRFVGSREEGGEYQAAITLLALNVGFPAVGGRLLRVLPTAPVERWSDFLRQLHPDTPEAERQEWARALTWTPEQQASLREVLRLLEGLKKPGLGMLESFQPYAEWAPRVGRYAFHWSLNAPAQERDAA
jgi:hypothetical protein